MIQLKNLLGIKQEEKADLYKLDNFDNPNSWSISELEMLHGMGFKVEASTHLSLDVDNINENNTKYSIYKSRSLGYCLEINDRKHFFKTFDQMLEKIDSFGTMDS